jgi:DNA helicase-2/ATP-dependent DNA helicase PcrA
MPFDLMEDLSRGPSWLSFARSSDRLENAHAARALRGQTGGAARPEKPYEGKTYNSADSIAEFFRQRGQQVNPRSATPPPSPTIKRRAEAGKSSTTPATNDAGGFAPGAHVKHAKYGRGLVLRREGTGDAAKLTISFPGFGQKKLIEKYAGLEKA